MKQASAAEKNAAIGAMRAEMMARHEGLTNGMLSRADMESTLREAIGLTAVGGSEKEAAMTRAIEGLDERKRKRCGWGWG